MAPALYVNCSRLVHRLVYTRVRGNLNQYFKNIQRCDVFVVSWLGPYHTFKPVCIYFAYEGTFQSLEGGGGLGFLNWINYLFHFLSAEVFFHTGAIFISVCVWRYIFISLPYILFCLCKFGSQTKPSLDMDASDPSKAKPYKFKGNLMMPDK